jgi:hypothetical protein
MSFFKYYNERQDADGVPLWWPGGPGGYPFRGSQPPQTTAKEFEELKLQGQFRCNTFHLSNPEELKQYVSIRDKCTNGLWSLIDRDRIWDEETKNYRIYLEWVEIAYGLPPQGGQDAVRNYTQSAKKLAGTRKDWW